MYPPEVTTASTYTPLLCTRHVRFTCDNDRIGASQRTGASCQKRPFALQQIYSITSSAMASTPGGISRPSALAVLRLMIQDGRRRPGLGVLRGPSPPAGDLASSS